MLEELRQFNLVVPEKLKQEAGNRSHRITFAAGGMVFAHNKVLLDRSDSSDLWSIPGGVVKFNESVKTTVIREIKQELNLNVEVLDSPPFLYHFRLESAEAMDIIILAHFLVKVESPARIQMGGDIVDYKWESIGSNFRDCYPNVKPAVDYYMNI